MLNWISEKISFNLTRFLLDRIKLYQWFIIFFYFFKDSIFLRTVSLEIHRNILAHIKNWYKLNSYQFELLKMCAGVDFVCRSLRPGFEIHEMIPVHITIIFGINWGLINFNSLRFGLFFTSTKKCFLLGFCSNR